MTKGDFSSTKFQSGNLSESNEPNQPRRSGSRKMLIWIALLFGFCLLGFLVVGLFYLIIGFGESNPPVVLINSPQYGDLLYTDQIVAVQTIARDENKVIRSELWVDGSLEHIESSNLPGGISPFPMLVDWKPIATGQHTLTVRAFNSVGKNSQASINVEAIELLDRDGDSVEDDHDTCPDIPGREVSDGCPDRDGDGIGDAADSCPDESGMPEGGGCPVPGEEDRDGDGMLDGLDSCPEVPGPPFAGGCPDRDGDTTSDEEDACSDAPGPPELDGCPLPGDMDDDGIADTIDECPEEPGPAEFGGCADDDGDGVTDSSDDCPDDPGLPDLSGCPDTDGDGAIDPEDLCPEIPGSDFGCPPGGEGGIGVDDRDGDGITDEIDLCPDEPGEPEHGGCPIPADDGDPGSDDMPSIPDGPVDLIPDSLLEPLLPEDSSTRMMVPVEFQALEFQLDADYDLITCYFGLAGEGMERWGPFELDGRRNWDLAEYASAFGTSNTVNLSVPVGEPLEVRIECGSEVVQSRGLDGSWGVYYDLGSSIESHDIPVGDAPVLSVDSSGGTDGRSFQVNYRICPGSCEAMDLPPPVISLLHGMGDHQLIIGWGGDRESIQRFNLYVNGTFITYISNHSYSKSVRSLEPPCGTRYEFHITASRWPEESPPSNTAYWTGEACPRQVQVSFEQILTGGYWRGPDEYQTSRNSRVGSIYGFFEAIDSDESKRVVFDATNEWGFIGVPYCQGEYLSINDEVSIPILIDWIHRQIDGCVGDGCLPYDASDVHYVTLELGARDDLTIGGKIKDCDRWSADDTLFNSRITLRPREIISGQYTISDRNITLVVEIRNLSGE